MLKVSRGTPSQWQSVPGEWQRPVLLPEGCSPSPCPARLLWVSKALCKALPAVCWPWDCSKAVRMPLPSPGTPHRGFIPTGKTSPSLFGIHSKSGRLLTVGVLVTVLVQLQPAF